MQRASSLLVRALVVTGALGALQGALAGDRNADRPRTNTFNLLVTATANPRPSPPPSQNGVGVAPAKPVVSNPYLVPLLQNAGTLRGPR